MDQIKGNISDNRLEVMAGGLGRHSVDVSIDEMMTLLKVGHDSSNHSVLFMRRVVSG